jgi:hypothetical protein
MIDRIVKAKGNLLITATVLNVLDLLTSYIGFSEFGLTELNAFATTLHMGNYLAALLACLTYETIVLLWYLLSLKHPIFTIFLVVFTAGKAMSVIGNALAYVGIYSINRIFLISQSILSALNT